MEIINIIKDVLEGARYNVCKNSYGILKVIETKNNFTPEELYSVVKTCYERLDEIKCRSKFYKRKILNLKKRLDGECSFIISQLKLGC